MLDKWIEYNGHSAYRMRIRDFTQADVRHLLETQMDLREPAWTPEGGTQRWLVMGNVYDVLRRNRRELVVIFVIYPNRYHVVTVEWADLYFRNPQL